MLTCVFVVDGRYAQDLLHGFPAGCERLQRFREELRSFQQLRWDDAWNNIVRPLFSDS